jgi:lysyl-tRNA synthetase class 1
MVSERSDDLSKRIEWAAKWARRQGKKPMQVPKLVPEMKKAMEDFANSLESAKDADGVQNAAFEAAKKNGLKPAQFFPAVYSILLGSDRGPRLGPYVIDAGPKEVRKTLLEAIAS